MVGKTDLGDAIRSSPLSLVGEMSKEIILLWKMFSVILYFRKLVDEK